jgi:hypothetical protein
MLTTAEDSFNLLKPNLEPESSDDENEDTEM